MTETHVVGFRLDGVEVEATAESSLPLMRLLREQLGVTHVKYGCGIGMCGTCTVYIDEKPVRACVFPARGVAGKVVATDRGLGGVVRTR